MTTGIEQTYAFGTAYDLSVTGLPNGDVLAVWRNTSGTISYQVRSGATIRSSGTISYVATSIDVAATADGAVAAFSVGGTVRSVQFDPTGVPGAVSTLATLPENRSVYEPDLVPLDDGRLLLHWLGIPQGQPPQAVGGTYYNQAVILDRSGIANGSVFALLDSPRDTWRVDAVTASGNGGWAIAYGGDSGPAIQRFGATGNSVGPQISATGYGGRDSDLAVLDSGLIAYQHSEGNFDSFERLQFYKPNGAVYTDINFVGEPNTHFYPIYNGYQSGSIVKLPDGRLFSVFSAFSSSAQGNTDTDVCGRLFYANGTPQGSQFRLTAASGGEQTDPRVQILDDNRVIVTFTQTGGSGNGTHASIIEIDPATPSPSTPGNDQILGTGGKDQLYGLEGNDRLTGGAGDDRLFGGDGDDQLVGGADRDVLIGGLGDDTYFITDTLDYIDEFNGGGIDTVIASIDYVLGLEENLFLRGPAITGYGNYGDNRIIGTSRHNILSGSGGNDHIDGGRGNDTLYGNEDDDLLIGGAGDDILSGDDGDDILIGGPGRDRMQGGAGADTFLFDKITDLSTKASLVDTLTFSRRDGDLIDLSAIDANPATRARDDFVFIGKAAFSGKSGELRYASNGAAAFAEADLDGDRKADFRIEVLGDIRLLETDFVLHAANEPLQVSAWPPAGASIVRPTALFMDHGNVGFQAAFDPSQHVALV